jgi:signal transduction histidine kinase/ActR/RegA family two-component response regulator
LVSRNQQSEIHDVTKPAVTGSRRDLSVLLVDDEKSLLTMLERAVSEAGYSCRAADSADRALVALKQSTVHVVVTDIRMPGLSGVQLAEAILEYSPQTLVIFMTGFSEYETLARAIQLRPFGFLEKPFQPQELLDLLDKGYDQHRSQEQRDEKAVTLEELVEAKTRDLEFQSERLLAEKELLHGIISNANFGLIAVDLSTQVHLINAFALDLLEVSDQAKISYLGAPLKEVLPAHCLPPFTELFDEIQQSAGLYRRDFTNDHNDTKLNVIAYPIRHREHVIAIVFIIHDMTETEMLQRRLLQSAKLASIGELAAGVAHEINNPLGFVSSNCNTLTGYLEKLTTYTGQVEVKLMESNEACPVKGEVIALKQTYDIEFIAEDSRQLLKETLDGLARVSKIVKDLKTFARADSDTPQLCSLNALLDDSLNLVRNEIKYTLDVDRRFGTIPDLVCYPNQLVQVFTNIFVNAAQAVPKHGTLTITSGVVGKAVVISIKDDGPGIPDKTLARIFDPFFTTKPAGKGTGMGLSISYGIVAKHGGTIRALSEMGQGTEFLVTLPLAGLAGSQATDTKRTQI